MITIRKEQAEWHFSSSQEPKRVVVVTKGVMMRKVDWRRDDLRAEMAAFWRRQIAEAFPRESDEARAEACAELGEEFERSLGLLAAVGRSAQ